MDRPVLGGRNYQQLEDLARSILASIRGIPASEVVLATRQVGSVLPTQEKSDTTTDLIEQTESQIIVDTFKSSHEVDDSLLTKRAWSDVRVNFVERHFRSCLPFLQSIPLESTFGNIIRQVNRLRTQSESFQLIQHCAELVSASETDREMIGLWKLLNCISRKRERPIDLLKGAQKYFEDRFLLHVLQVSRASGCQSGLFRDEIQAYLQQLPNQPESGQNIWMSIYYCLRAGDCDTASWFAKKTSFPDGFGLDLPDYYFSAWANRASHAPWVRFPELSQACILFMRHGARRKLNSEYRYMLMSICFLCGQIQTADALISESPQAWDSLDEFLWYSIGCVRTSADSPNTYVYFDIERLQSRLTAYEESYYTSNGQKPLRYVMVLMAGLELRRAIRFLLTDRNCCQYISHTVHMVIALHWQGVFASSNTGDSDQLKEEDIVDLIIYYARSLANHNGILAWEYYLLAQEFHTSATEELHIRLARCLIDLLEKSRNFRLIHGRKSVLDDHVDANVKRMIMELAAQQCMEQSKVEIALELYIAADCTLEAVQACNHKISHLLLRMWTWVQQRRQKSKQKVQSEVETSLSRCQELLDFLSNDHEETRMLHREMQALNTMFEILEDFVQQQFLSVIEKTQNLSFLQKIDVQKLMKEYPAIPLNLHMVFSLFCDSIKELCKKPLESYQRAQYLSRLQFYHDFVSIIPPPFTQRWTVQKDIETTRELVETNIQ